MNNNWNVCLINQKVLALILRSKRDRALSLSLSPISKLRPHRASTDNPVMLIVLLSSIWPHIAADRSATGPDSPLNRKSSSRNFRVESSLVCFLLSRKERRPFRTDPYIVTDWQAIRFVGTSKAVSIRKHLVWKKKPENPVL